MAASIGEGIAWNRGEKGMTTAARASERALLGKTDGTAKIRKGEKANMTSLVGVEGTISFLVLPN